MLDFFADYGGTMIVGAIVLAVVALIVAKLVRDRRSGKHCCGGDCGKCCKCSSKPEE